MSSPILVGKAKADLHLLPQMANRHGLIAGATGTGKTITLQVLAENFSAQGVPVFLADVKGDLAGISQPGGASPKVQQRLAQLQMQDYPFAGCPMTCWDVFGQNGHPVRTTISEMGPLLLARLLQLNDTQGGVLHLVFRVADANGLLLLDLKDLRAMLQFVGENAARFTTEFGNVSAASIGAIQRNLLTLDSQGGDKFFGEPALNLDDFLQTDAQGRGVINLLAADRLMQSPKVYATLLLWLLSELFERLPEAGDLPQPKLVFFFDEAHLLFHDAPPALLEKIEQVVRLIRSKGVGVYFVTQNPRDVPDRVLGQLGNRIQHALRAFTPLEQQSVKAAAKSFRANPAFDTETVLQELGVGEALVSCLDENGQPGIVERAFIVPPHSQIGPISTAQRQQLLETSLVRGVYENAIDRESAYEKLKAAAQAPAVPRSAATPRPAASAPAAMPAPAPAATGEGGMGGLFSGLFQKTSARGDSIATTMAKSVVRTMGSSVGREIVRGVLGSIFGGTRRR